MIRTMIRTILQGLRQKTKNLDGIRPIHPILIHLTIPARVFRVHPIHRMNQVIIQDVILETIRGDDRIMARVITLQVKAEVTTEAATMVVVTKLTAITTMTAIAAVEAMAMGVDEEATMATATEEERNDTTFSIEQRLKRTPTGHECGSPPCK